ncbi:MAG: DUF1553 domain-containing protein [Pirellulales bacterium]
MVRSALPTLLLLFCAFAIPMLRAADDVQKPVAPGFAAADKVFYTEKVKPLLAKHCWNCHSHAGGEAGGELMLDARALIVAGGDRGAVIVPGEPDKSLLIKAIEYQDNDLRMPEKGKLAQAEIDVLKEWIKRGAPWNDDGVDATKKTAKMSSRPRGWKLTDADRAYWAFQSPKAVDPPTVTDAAWNKHPIDRFVGKKLEEHGFTHAPQAEKLALLRRVTQDLIGLPPTTLEIDEFLADTQPDAYDRAVERLLSSLRYGERWARHWFDAVRYSESDGFRADAFRPTAWRYRDYVIRAFNEDKPYDRFVKEQLAGDEIDPENPDALAATGYLRLGVYEYNNRDAIGQWSAMLNEITDVTGDVFLGLGMGCARCHDHKFDPILQKDYFRLQAYFAAIDLTDDRPLATQAEIAAHAQKLKIWEDKAALVRAEIEELEGPARVARKKAVEIFPPDIQKILNADYAKLSNYEKQLYNLAYRQIDYEYERLDSKFKDEQKKQLVDLRKKLDEFAALKPAPLATTLTVRDIGEDAPAVRIPKKGDDAIAPGVPSAIDANDALIPPAKVAGSTGRRTALAEWLTKSENPLTARVMVNRVWQAHFGRGLVPTSSDFGTLSGGPSHPELLDWLARKFVDEDWRLKPLHRLIVTSETYKQAAMMPTPNETAATKDAENRWLWCSSTKRLDSEQIRDAVLAATGKLDLQAGGPSVEPSVPRRSIYVKSIHNQRDPLLDVFDTPDAFLSIAERNVTTTPSQSLLLINSPQVLKQARDFAGRLEKEYPQDVAARVNAAYRQLYGRGATERDVAVAKAFLAAHKKSLQPTVDPAGGFQYAKMPYREGRAAVLQPGQVGPRLVIPDSDKLPTGDFTIEAFINLRSLFDDATVRVIASQGRAENGRPGWTFGVTSKRSAYKPQVLVLQLWGNNGEGKMDYEAVFSNLHIELNKPYYVCATLTLNKTAKDGIVFYSKDLSNDDEPLQVSSVAHKITAIPKERGPIALGQVFGAKTTAPGMA